MRLLRRHRPRGRRARLTRDRPTNEAPATCRGFRFWTILAHMVHWLFELGGAVSSTCGDWCLHLWEVTGVWFTGFATFAAVITSLILARREQVRLRVSATMMTVLRHGEPQPWPEILLITVSNVGGRPATIEGIGWRRRPWSRLHGYQQFGVPGHLRPPATIEPGNACKFTLPLRNPGIEWEVSFLEDFVGRWPRIGVHLVRVIAWTPAGQRTSAWLAPSLKTWLIKASVPASGDAPAVPGE